MTRRTYSLAWRIFSCFAPLLFALLLLLLAVYTYQAGAPLPAIGGSPIPR